MNNRLNFRKSIEGSQDLEEIIDRPVGLKLISVINSVPSSPNVNLVQKRMAKNKNSRHQPESGRKIHYLWAPLTVGIGLLIYYGISRSTNSLPTALYDGERNYTGKFIAERAQNILKNFLVFGERVVGSMTNEVVAVQFLENEAKKIIEMALPVHHIEYDIQVASGAYYLSNMVNIYQGIQNFIVKLCPKDDESLGALLINTHFDTPPGSVGAGDAGTMLAVMLEILRVIATSSKPLKHCVIFLFNGAEENPLQGSHAFITQHKWAPQVKAFINLDSAGNGGKEIMFQAGPEHPWLMKYYRKAAPYPYASTLGEEMFQSGLIPSDTDYRIFKYFGKIPGMDFAYNYNGYVYHTKFDKIDTIPVGTFQNTGENILALTQALANSEELTDPSTHSKGHMIFFDYLGLFLVSYTETDAILINVITSIAYLISICISIRLMSIESGMTKRDLAAKLGLILVVQLISLGMAVGIPILLAVIIDTANLSMSWYSETWMIFGLYFCPIFFILGFVPAYYLGFQKKSPLTLSHQIQLVMHALCLIYVIMLLLFTSLLIRSAFVLMICVMFYTIPLIINIVVKFHNHRLAWLAPHLIFQLVPMMFYSYMAQIVFTTFVPMAGRRGSATNPELLISVFTVVFGVFIGGFILPLFSLCRKSKTVISMFIATTVVFLIIMATPLGFPYQSAVSPQRHMILHTQRTFHNFDKTIRRNESGYFLIPLDRHSPDSIKESVANMSLARSTQEDCATEIFCGLPLYMSFMRYMANHSYWIPADAPRLYGPVSLNHLSTEKINDTNTKYSFSMSGSDHLAVFVQPLPGVKLVNWSFLNIRPYWDTIYFIYFSYGKISTPYNFTLEFEIPLNSSVQTFNIAIAAHFTHHPYLSSPEFYKFLKSFPRWTTIQSWISSFESWQY